MTTLEVSDARWRTPSELSCTLTAPRMGQANVFYTSPVPTPIDEYKQPDLTPLVKASEDFGASAQASDIVIYESTRLPPAPPGKTAVRREVAGTRVGPEIQRRFHRPAGPPSASIQGTRLTSIPSASRRSRRARRRSGRPGLVDPAL